MVSPNGLDELTPSFCHLLGNYYLMHPQLTYGSNSLSFSSCSVTAIETLVAAKGSCLLNGAELAALLRPTTSTTSPTTVSTTAMPTTTASASCPPVVDAISCYYNCRGNGYSFSLHFASYKGCAGVCLCSNTGEVEPSLQSSTTSALPSEEVTLVECPSCSLSDLPKKVKTVNSNKSGAIKFKFKAASCPAGHVFTACIQRRNGSGKIKGNVKVSGTKIGKILLRRHENKKCWQMVVPPGLAEDGTKIQFKAKSKGPSFDLQTDLRVVSKAKHCTDV